MYNTLADLKSFTLMLIAFSTFLLHEKINSHAQEQALMFKSTFDGISIFFENAHDGVRRSLISGLQKLEIPYNLNPSRSQDTFKIVFCLDSMSLLKRCIDLKNRNKIKKLLVGPNILARTCMENHILSNPAIDYYLTPSEWNRIACIEDEPPLEKTIRIWPAGIDAEFWKPQVAKKDTRDVLLYWKTESEEFCKKISKVLIRNNWKPVIIKYGAYDHEHYKKILNQVKFAIFVSRSESQGLALAECWSMNVPTLVWDSQEPLEYLGKIYNPINSCPYLTKATGKRWKQLSELEDLLKTMQSYCQEFSAREWVLNNMTDEISVNLLLKIINE